MLWNIIFGAFGLYRLDVATAAVQRVGGLEGCTSPYDPFGATLAPPAVSTQGGLAVFGTRGDCTFQNLDGSGELFTIDRLTAPKIYVSGGSAPAIVSWDVESGPTTYEVINQNLFLRYSANERSVSYFYDDALRFLQKLYGYSTCLSPVLQDNP